MDSKGVVISKKQLRDFYWKKGLTASHIGLIFGCTAGTVINRMREYNIRRRVSGPKRIRLKENLLQKLYQKQGLSAQKVSEIFHCDSGVVLRTLRKHQIPIRHPKAAIPIQKEELEELYTKRGFSTYKIARQLQCDPKTVYRYLKLYGVAIRGRKLVPLTKEQLKKLYVYRRISISKIAKSHNCAPSAILRKLRKYKIPRRSISEACTKHIKRDFHGAKADKAYLIGFRVGDLHVRKDQNRINIGCGTTKIAQSELIRDLFKRYGPGWVGKKDAKGRFHIQYSLNQTFSFLLPKHKNVPTWIMRNKNFFLNFLAGYTDAEGNIGVYNNRARFRIRTYDKGVLSDCNKKLQSLGIRSIFGLEYKILTDEKNQKLRKIYWGVSVNRAEDLRLCFKELRPLLRHQKRKRDLNTALQNVVLRLS